MPGDFMTIFDKILQLCQHIPITTLDQLYDLEAKSRAKNAILRLHLLNPDLVEPALNELKKRIIINDTLNIEDDYLETIYQAYIKSQHSNHKQELVCGFIEETYFDFMFDLIEAVGFESATFLRYDVGKIRQYFTAHPMFDPLDSDFDLFVKRFEVEFLDFNQQQLASIFSKTNYLTDDFDQLINKDQLLSNPNKIRFLDTSHNQINQINEAVAIIRNRIFKTYSTIDVSDLYSKRSRKEPFTMRFVKEELDLDNFHLAIFTSSLDNLKSMINNHILSFKIERLDDVIDVLVFIEVK